MATTLESTCELAWLQLFPKGADDSSITKEEFIETGRSELAYQMLLMAWKEKATEGVYNIPSYLLSQVEKKVVDNEMDISDLNIITALPQEIWLVSIGGWVCECKYVKSTINLSQIMCDTDDGLGDGVKTYFVLGKKIIFPKGVHTSPLKIIYANSGNSIDGETPIQDELAAVVRVRLIEIYGGKIGKEDSNNDGKSDQ